MASKDIDSQFQFLISCIKHSTNGKVDFAEVAEDCSIVSKGAAAKRYERLMKAHGITNNASGAAGGPSKTPVKKEKGENEGKTPKGRASKKRKLEQVDEDAGDIDEPSVKGEVKSEIKSEVKREDGMTVKSEPGGGAAPAGSLADVFTTPNRQVGDGGGGDDDDDVFVVSATDHRDGSVYNGGGHHNHRHHHHHHHHRRPELAAHAHAHHHHAMPHFHHPMNHAADLTFHRQILPTLNPRMTLTATTPTAASRMRVGSNPAPSDVLPYGFPASRNFHHNHDTSGFH